jgi:hypothetical protein
MYYHDGFLTDFPVGQSSAEPERCIIGRISNILLPELKARFVRFLHEVWARSKPLSPEQFVDPVDYASSAGGRRSHKIVQSDQQELGQPSLWIVTRRP